MSETTNKTDVMSLDDALQELAKHPDLLISLAKIGEAARKSGEKLKAALAPEPRFYKNQPVLVEASNGDIYRKFFHCYNEKAEFGAYFSVVNHPGSVSFDDFTNCKPDPDAESIINWIEHDGSNSGFLEAKDAVIIVIKNDGESDSNNESFYLDKNIARYTIIPLPEYL